MQDVITRDIMVKAPKERVYKALTDAKEITSWFPDVIEGSLAVGERPVFIFTNDNHKVRTYIEAAKPFEYFAYRWVPGGDFLGDVLTVQNTLVEFMIEETDEGTKVTVKESGFAALPAEDAQLRFDQNSGGWEYMMGRLEKVLG